MFFLNYGCLKINKILVGYKINKNNNIFDIKSHNLRAFATQRVVGKKKERRIVSDSSRATLLSP